MQCLSFGHSKILEIGRGGAILLDDVDAYNKLLQQRSDGRDLSINPWQNQTVFNVGYHYRPTIEEAIQASVLLANIGVGASEFVQYPDLRKIKIYA